MKQIPDTPEGMLDLLSDMSDEELQEMLEAQAELERRLAQQGPKNDDELHEWLKADMGIDIPRVAICEGHTAPFDFLSDLYFERTTAAIGVANRGGAKTFMVAVLHWLNSKFKPGCESLTFGATEAQSLRCYAHLKDWIYDKDGNQREDISMSIMRETKWKNGSKTEIVPGTPAAVNGPHPQKAHADEIELMDEETWKESRNLTVSKALPGGVVIKPQDISTSTRKGPSGRVQHLIDEIEKAVREGYKPPRKIYMWCIKETAAEVPDCQMAPQQKREDRLKELGRDPCETCDCDLIRRGEWEDGSPRLLSQVCKGDLFRSRGWQPYGDVAKQFTENDRETFEAQQLCSKPEMRHHYLPTFGEERNVIVDYMPNPENGPIFQSVDWGGTNPHAVNWYQLLAFEVEAENFLGATIRLKEGSLICFDEIYIAEIGNEKLGGMVIHKEQKWQRKFPDFRIYERFADPQGKAARMDWKAKGLKTSWHVTREFDEHIKIVRDLVDDGLLYVDKRCPMWIKEAKAWRKEPSTDRQIDEFNHCFVAGTLVSTDQGEIPIEEVRKGDQVWTRNGLRKVTAAGVSGYADKFVRLCVNNGKILTCTPNHLISTPNMGWSRADAIEAGVVVHGSLAKLYGEESRSDVTNPTVITGRSWAAEKMASGFISIVKFGNTITGRFPRVMKSIIGSMTINTQRMLSALNCSQLPIIEGNIPGISTVIQSNTLKQLGPAFKSGRNYSSARSADSQPHVSGMAEIVVTNAEQISLPKQPVYDLTVEEEHEFFAEGVLVHNCMSNFRYAAANIRKIHRRALRSGAVPISKPIHRQAGVTKVTRSGDESPIAFRGHRAEDKMAEWRKSLGEPIRRTQ